MPNFEGNRGTKTILGNREHNKTNFRFLGNKPIYFRGTREKVVSPPPPPGRASVIEDQARGGGDSIPARGLGLAENDGFHMA